MSARMGTDPALVHPVLSHVLTKSVQVVGIALSERCGDPAVHPVALKKKFTGLKNGAVYCRVLVCYLVEPAGADEHVAPAPKVGSQ